MEKEHLVQENEALRLQIAQLKMELDTIKRMIVDRKQKGINKFEPLSETLRPED